MVENHVDVVWSIFQEILPRIDDVPLAPSLR